MNKSLIQSEQDLQDLRNEIGITHDNHFKLPTPTAYPCVAVWSSHYDTALGEFTDIELIYANDFYEKEKEGMEKEQEVEHAERGGGSSVQDEEFEPSLTSRMPSWASAADGWHTEDIL